jgi:site-specific recombinase XerD
MTSTVRVVRPVAVEPATIVRLLGAPGLPVEHVRSPSILVDGRFHSAAGRWLRRRHNIRPVEATTSTHARRLAGYIRYLRNVRGLDHPDEWQADVFAASEDDIRALYRARQYDRDTRVSSNAWRGELSTIKQFHEFAREVYGIPIPFRVVTFTNPAGYRATTAPDLKPRTRTRSRGTPITPGFVELLIQGGYRIDHNGRQTSSRSVDRDGAFISLAVGTGMRLGTLVDVTTYEVPTRSAQRFATIRVPDFITKGDAGGEALVFAHRLDAVHNYIAGARAELVANGRRYSPDNPIHLVEADRNAWSADFGGTVRSYPWPETDADTRRRLVNPDGSSPILWLNAYAPKPLTYDHAGSITSDARKWTRAHVHGDFPARFRTHDLRHTYATHLTVCIYKQALAPHVHPDLNDAYTPVRIADAVEMAKLSLGHASEDSTRLYVQHAPTFLHIDIDEFFGGR